ncbi:MAG: class I SAM-dependent methyltransferase, partial [Proteobacteria bacterium]|nr:class I SAM-dependent methyltransferase [Pseudomonadota bacterium]
RPANLVELGAYKGYSYFAFCQAVKASKIACRCHAVDTWQGDDQAGFYGEEVYGEVRGHNDEHYAEFSRLLRMTFDQALAQFPDGSVDLLHIDGFHSYEQVKHDFDTWLPKLSDRAVVLLHDIHVRREGFGVFRLWEELSERYPHFEFTHGYGLGVLGVGASVPEGVSALFAANADQRLCYEIRAAYQRLGAALVQQGTVASLRGKITKLQVLLKAFSSKLAMRDAQFDEVTNSTAWRITRPLRALSGRLKKLAGK